MDHGDRQIITRNIVRLIKLTDIDPLIPKLLEKGVFSRLMIDYYLPHTGDSEEVRKRYLYLDIQRRGPTAFKKLIESLEETEQFEVAQLLQPDFGINSEPNSQRIVSLDTLPIVNETSGTTLNQLPAYFPRQLENRLVELSFNNPNAHINLSTTPLHVEMKYGETRWDLMPRNPNVIVYRVGSRPKGYVLIINNIKFINNIKDEREGAELDHQNLKRLFELIGYEVEVHVNLKLNDMKRTLREFAQMEKHRQVDSCIVSILSHGSDNDRLPGTTDIMASDGQNLSTLWVLECFNNYQCPLLAGKPKIFIFQVCRGNAFNYSVRRPEMPRPRIQTDGYRQTTMRAVSDMLMAYSTIPGFVSNRDIYLGTWYIQTMCKVFMEHAHDTEIQQMLTMVDNDLKPLIAMVDTSPTMQTASFENWGFQQFYFNPGLYDSSDTASSPPNESDLESTN